MTSDQSDVQNISECDKKCKHKGDRVCYYDTGDKEIVKEIRPSPPSSSESQDSDSLHSGESLYKTFTFDPVEHSKDMDKCISFWSSVLQQTLKPVKCIPLRPPRKVPTKEKVKKDKVTETAPPPPQDADQIWIDIYKQLQKKNLHKIKLMYKQPKRDACFDYIDDQFGAETQAQEIRKLNTWTPQTQKLSKIKQQKETNSQDLKGNQENDDNVEDTITKNQALQHSEAKQTLQPLEFASPNEEKLEIHEAAIESHNPSINNGNPNESHHVNNQNSQLSPRIQPQNLQLISAPQEIPNVSPMPEHMTRKGSLVVSYSSLTSPGQLPLEAKNPNNPKHGKSHSEESDISKATLPGKIQNSLQPNGTCCTCGCEVADCICEDLNCSCGCLIGECICESPNACTCGCGLDECICNSELLDTLSSYLESIELTKTPQVCSKTSQTITEKPDETEGGYCIICSHYDCCHGNKT